MKKVISAISVMLFVIGLFCFCSYAETHYIRIGKVTKINSDEITVEDNCGYLWTFEGDGFHIGEQLELVMNNNHTDSNIYDDMVVDVKKIKTTKK